jgi:DNA-3-methyladenine glycosylase II
MTIKKAAEFLKKADPVLGVAIKKIKLKLHRGDENYFRSLCEAILSQQISVAAADTITARFCALFPGKDFPEPEQVLRAPISKLRKAGVSRQKIAYIKDLAKAIKTGQLDIKDFSRHTDEEVIVALTRVKGIGQWTAEMFMMFSLNRPNVFSAGDLGLQNAIKKLYGLRRHPDKKKMERISKAWHPHRTLAARYLWASLKIED